LQTDAQWERQWIPPFKLYDNINTIVGIGRTNSLVSEYNFIDRAYEDGYLEYNVFTF